MAACKSGLVARALALLLALTVFGYGSETYGEIGPFQPLYQPGTLLFSALFLGAWVQRATLEQLSSGFFPDVPTTSA